MNRLPDSAFSVPSKMLPQNLQKKNKFLRLNLPEIALKMARCRIILRLNFNNFLRETLTLTNGRNIALFH